jgi:uncharacterized protein (DUF427 family)
MHASTAKAMKIPGPDHPITIEQNAHRVLVRYAGRVIADTKRALTLKEASYPAVLYIPRDDVAMAVLEKTAHATHCPYKGDASYYSIKVGGATSQNAIWTYEAPYDAVRQIKDYLAFYPDRVDEITET